MVSGLKAGVAYFGIVFAAGFVLGTLRILVVAPAIGTTAAVLVELPVMLAISWIACRRMIRRFSVSDDWAVRLVMGAVAFALLMVAEWVLGIAAFGRTVAEQIAAYGTPDGMIGFVGQAIFAVFPLIQLSQTAK
jgi:hypothetical protein